MSGQQGGDFCWLVDHTSAWPKSFDLLERNDVSTFDGLNHPRNVEVAIFSEAVLNVVGYELHNGYSRCSRSIVRDARGLHENSARNGRGCLTTAVRGGAKSGPLYPIRIDHP